MTFMVTDHRTGKYLGEIEADSYSEAAHAYARKIGAGWAERRTGIPSKSGVFQPRRGGAAYGESFHLGDCR